DVFLSRQCIVIVETREEAKDSAGQAGGMPQRVPRSFPPGDAFQRRDPVSNFAELFKPPETTRSNHQRPFNAAVNLLTSTRKTRVQSAFSKKDQYVDNPFLAVSFPWRFLSFLGEPPTIEN